MRQHNDISTPGTAVMAACAVIGAAATVLSQRLVPLLIALAIGLFFMFSIKIVRQ
jgi:hypothetical protein